MSLFQNDVGSARFHPLRCRSLSQVGENWMIFENKNFEEFSNLTCKFQNVIFSKFNVKKC